MSGILHHELSQFVRRNTFLYACLGLLSLARRTEHVVGRGSASPLAEPEPASAPADTEGDELLRFAALGALSLARKYRAELETTRGASPVTVLAASPGARGARPRPRDFAR